MVKRIGMRRLAAFAAAAGLRQYIIADGIDQTEVLRQRDEFRR